MNDQELRERLRSAEWPAPSAELRARVAATPLRPQTIAWSDRIWYSRGWRIGAAAAVAAVIAFDIWGARAIVPAAPTTIAHEAEAQAIADLMRSVGFSDDVANSIALRRATASSAITIDRMSLMSGENR